jgi:hypothetical protein
MTRKPGDRRWWDSPRPWEKIPEKKLDLDLETCHPPASKVTELEMLEMSYVEVESRVLSQMTTIQMLRAAEKLQRLSMMYGGRPGLFYDSEANPTAERLNRRTPPKPEPKRLPPYAEFRAEYIGPNERLRGRKAIVRVALSGRFGTHPDDVCMAEFLSFEGVSYGSRPHKHLLSHFKLEDES